MVFFLCVCLLVFSYETPIILDLGLTLLHSELILAIYTYNNNILPK